MTKPRALDLFCGAGGVSEGLRRAGFEVVGVDIAPQPRYRGGVFVQADALAFPLEGFDLVWASPPCQRYTMFARNLGTSGNHPDLVPPMLARLRAQAAPWILENVVGAPVCAQVMLCGTMFGLELLRHRLFETSFPIATLLPPCNHRGGEIPVYGNGTPKWHRERFGRGVRIDEKRAAMGIDWMNRGELSEAIPPAYAEWLGRQAMRVIEGARRAA